MCSYRAQIKVGQNLHVCMCKNIKMVYFLESENAAVSGFTGKTSSQIQAGMPSQEWMEDTQQAEIKFTEMPGHSFWV